MNMKDCQNLELIKFKEFGKVNLEDISQMQMYVNYYVHDIKLADENKTIGILISTNKNEIVVKYTLPEDNETIFSSEFRFTIPCKKRIY